MSLKEDWTDAGLDLEVDSGPVAPLLQQVAADVKHFVRSCGLSRMPTRSEMHSEGQSRACMHHIWQGATLLVQDLRVAVCSP